jgi:hypothetical protein
MYEFTFHDALTGETIILFGYDIVDAFERAGLNGKDDRYKFVRGDYVD